MGDLFTDRALKPLEDFQKALESIPKVDRGIDWESRSGVRRVERLTVYGATAAALKVVLDNTIPIIQAVRVYRQWRESKHRMEVAGPHRPPLEAGELRDTFALIHSLDRHEILEAGYDMPDGSWSHFQSDPVGRFLDCNDECREAITKALNKRRGVIS